MAQSILRLEQKKQHRTQYLSYSCCCWKHYLEENYKPVVQVSYEGELVLRSAQLFIKLAMLDLELKLMGAMVFAKKN